MTALAITAAEVLPTTDTVIETGVAGAVITAGQIVYYDASSKSYKLFDGNDTAANTKTPKMALNSASSGQPLAVAAGGDVTIGATAAATTGLIYCAGIVPGGILPSLDIASGNRVTIIGVGKASNKMQLVLNNSGVTP